MRHNFPAETVPTGHKKLCEINSHYLRFKNLKAARGRVMPAFLHCSLSTERGRSCKLIMRLHSKNDYCIDGKDFNPQRKQQKTIMSFMRFDFAGGVGYGYNR